jgi:hypothetical protein
MPEMQHRGGVRHRVAVQLDSGKAAQRLAVIERVLDRFVGQPVPLLHEIDPQHACQRDRRPAAFAFRIEWPQSLLQPRPRYNPLHIGQKLIAPRLLLLTGVFHLGKASLPLHRPVPQLQTAHLIPPRRQIRLTSDGVSRFRRSWLEVAVLHTDVGNEVRAGRPQTSKEEELS